MSDSILNSVKKLLGLAEDYEAFDPDVIMHINSVFTRLHSLGVGPTLGFSIENSSATWTSYLAGDKRYNNVKSYMVARVRLMFDPPTTSFAIKAIEDQITQFEWLINAQREDDKWVDPMPPDPDPEEDI